MLNRTPEINAKANSNKKFNGILFFLTLKNKFPINKIPGKNISSKEFPSKIHIKTNNKFSTGVNSISDKRSNKNELTTKIINGQR